MGRDDLVSQLIAILQGRQSSNGFDNYIYSDMPAYDALGRAGKLSVFNAVYAESYILGSQVTNTGAWADFMSTAEAVRALNYLDPGAAANSSVGQAISSGCSWLKSMQKTDGSFEAGSDDPVIDTSEAVATQVALGLTPATWTNGGKSAADYMETSALNSDGSFGTSKNVMDATWALDSFTMLGIHVTQTLSVSAVNGTVTVNLSAAPATTPAITDFAVTQSINGAVATSVTPTAISTSGTTVTLTVPQVTATTYSQSVVISVSYQGGTAVAATAFTVPATSGSVNVRVEGPTGNLADTTVSVSGSALDALEAAVGSSNVGTSTSSYGIYINSIDGVSGNPAVTSSVGTGWLYYVIRNGAIDPNSLSSGADGYTVDDGDQVVFYIGAYQTVSPYANLTYYPVVTLSPQSPTAGQSVTISVYADNFDNYTSLEPLTSAEAAAIGNYTVTAAGASYQVGNGGQVTIPGSDVTAGTLAYTVTNYNSAGYPNVVRYAGSISVASASSGGGTSLISVGVAIVGPNGSLYGPTYVNVNPSNKWGLTALGALDATGVPYTMDPTYTGWVDAIDGVENNNVTLAGWMYTVNDSPESIWCTSRCRRCSARPTAIATSSAFPSRYR